MMKFKGKEYPVSVFKVHVHDTVLDRLTWLKDKLKLQNNVDTFTVIVNQIYNQVQALDDYFTKGEIAESGERLKTLQESTKELTEGVEIDLDAPLIESNE